MAATPSEPAEEAQGHTGAEAAGELHVHPEAAPVLPESNSYLLTSDSSSAAKSRRETTALQTIVEEVGGWK